LPTIKRRVTEYEYICHSFVKFNEPITEILISYEPLKLRDIYRDYEARKMLKPTIEHRETIRTYEMDISEFVKHAKQKHC